MLETPSIRRYSSKNVVTPTGYDSVMGSENPSGAGNQQERPGSEEWIVGFVDGEGCFSISVVRNATCALGWQVQHEFAVTQAAPSRAALEYVRDVLGCGRIVEQLRHDNHRSSLLRFSVKRRDELIEDRRSVLQRTSTQNREAARLRAVRSRPPDDGGRSAPHGGGPGAHRLDHRGDESPAAVSVSGILRGHTPAISARR